MKVLWFNPPLSENFKTKVGKISYKCIPNIKSVINAHNKKILNLPTKPLKRFCKCTDKARCPLNKNCLTISFIRQPYHRHKKVTGAKYITI